MADSERAWRGQTGVINRDMIVAAGIDADDVRSEEFAGY